MEKFEQLVCSCEGLLYAKNKILNDLEKKILEVYLPALKKISSQKETRLFVKTEKPIIDFKYGEWQPQDRFETDLYTYEYCIIIDGEQIYEGEFSKKSNKWIAIIDAEDWRLKRNNCVILANAIEECIKNVKILLEKEINEATTALNF